DIAAVKRFIERRYNDQVAQVAVPLIVVAPLDEALDGRDVVDQVGPVARLEVVRGDGGRRHGAELATHQRLVVRHVPELRPDGDTAAVTAKVEADDGEAELLQLLGDVFPTVLTAL